MQTILPPRLRGILVAAFMAGSMMAAASAADPVPVSAASGARDDASNTKASSNVAFTFEAGGLPIILTAPHGGSAALLIPK